MKATTVIIVLTSILFSSLLNGLLTMWVGKGVLSYTKDISKGLFYAGFLVSLLLGIISLVMNLEILKVIEGEVPVNN